MNAWLDAQADGLALLFWSAIAGVAFLLVAAALQRLVRRIDESNPNRLDADHLHQVTAGRARQASERDHARDAEYRDEISRRAQWIRENTWHGDVPATQRGNR